MRNLQKGQVLILFAFALVAVLVLAGALLDGGLMMFSWWGLQEDADAACIAGATGGDPNVALAAAGQPGAALTWTSRTLRVEIDKTEPVYFLQLVGFNELSFVVRSRCLVPQAAFVPIAVKRPWMDEGLIDLDLEYGILGQEADQCDDCKGADFSGAIIPNIVCSNVDCDPRFFYGLDEKKSPNTYKSDIEELLRGQVRVSLADIGTRVPQISGVSNKFLVQAMADTYEVGDHLIVIIFDGTIEGPSPWENLAVVSYAEVEITDLSDPNTLWVKFIKEIDNLSDVELLTLGRTVSWTWIEG